MQDYSESRGRDDDFTRLREKIQPDETTHLRGAGYENLHPPVQIIGVSETFDDSERSDRILAYYTDIELPSDPKKREKKIRKIRSLYNQRSKIEEEFKASKNAFDVATDSDDPVRKSFYLHMSVLFYNLYKIVDTVPAPNSGLQIDTRQKEVLIATRDLAFNNLVRSGPWEHQFRGS